MTSLGIPGGPDDVTPEWMTEALRSTGVIKKAAIVSMESERLGLGMGFTGQIARFSLEFDSNEDGSPTSLIAKFPSSDAAIRKTLNDSGFYEREVRFYREIADSVDLGTPAIYYSDVDVEPGRYLLLQEDLGGARLGDSLRGCSLEDAEIAIGEIAKFHAAFWDSPRLQSLDWISRYDSPDDMQTLFAKRWGPFTQKAKRILTPTLLEVGERYSKNAARIRNQQNQSHRTVVHGDYRLDNIFFATGGKDTAIVVIDWQLCSIGRGVADVSYLLAECMDIDQRRASEADLLKLYHATLLENGIEGYDFQQCLYDYRLNMLHVLYVAVLAGASLNSSSRRGILLAKAATERISAAMDDHNVLDLITQ